MADALLGVKVGGVREDGHRRGRSALSAVHGPRHAQSRTRHGGPGIRLAADRRVAHVSQSLRAYVGQPPTAKASPARQTNWIKAFIIRHRL